MTVITGKAVALAMVLSCFCSLLKAQFNTPRHEVGVTGGVFVYQGDITPEKAGAWKSPGLAMNLFYSRILSPSFSLRTNLAVGKLTADDLNYDSPDWRQRRGFRFATRTTELSELLVWNVLKNNYGDRHKVSPYLFGGVGISALRISRDWHRYDPEFFAADDAFLTGLGKDTTTSLPSLIPVIPIGGGIRYHISPKLSVMAEASFRITFTDYIDGFSQSAGPDVKDYYANYSIGLIYTLGDGGGGGSNGRGSLKCPPVRR
jgi:hypothetical protein